MMQLLSKNDVSSLCYNVIITLNKFKNDKFGDFSCVIDYIALGQTYLEMLYLLELIKMTPGARRAAPADTKCSPAPQRKQAKRACGP